MTVLAALDVHPRTTTGTGAARETRRQGFVPVSLYGNDKTPKNLQIEERLLIKEMNHTGFTTKIFEIVVDGKKERALVRDVQPHPVTDRPLHVDLLRVSKNSKIQLQVPLHFINADKSPGLKAGGVLNIVHHTVDVYCSPDTIPEHFEVDLGAQNIGFSLHMPDILLEKGVSFVNLNEHETLATIVPPKISAASADDGSEEDDDNKESAE